MTIDQEARRDSGDAGGREGRTSFSVPVGPAIAAFAFLGYLLTGRYVGACGDEAPHRFLALAISQHGTLTLDAYRAIVADAYFVGEHAGRLWSVYPPGMGFFAAPFMLLADLAADPVEASLSIAKVLAAGLTALSVAIVHATVRRLQIPPARAVGITIVYAFATPIFSIASQSMCTHPLAIVIVATAMYAAVRLREGGYRWALVIWLAIGAMTWTRPQTLPMLLPLGVVAILVRSRGANASLLRSSFVALPAVLLAAPTLLYNVTTSGSVRGPYTRFNFRYGGNFRGDPFEGLAGLLVSPSRGLLVYVPLVLVGIAGGLRAVRRREPIGIGLFLGFVALLLVHAKFTIWWGGATYGPRFFTETMPLFAVLGAPLVAHRSRRLAVRLLLVAVIAWSLFVHAVGALTGGCDWSGEPVAIREDRSRLWSVTDSPISRCASQLFTDAAPDDSGLTRYP